MNKKFKAVLMFTSLAFLKCEMYAASVVPDSLYQVTVVQTAARAINYRNLKGMAEIDLKGTILLPEAKGSARVRNKAGSIDIAAEFKNISSATQFGHEYLTYVFWAVSPDGRASNLGELIVKDGNSKLSVHVPMQALSLLVTAEPYFAVSQPSNVVILENAIRPNNNKKIEFVEAKYELLEKGEYTKNMSAADLQPMVMDKNTPFNVYQARNAVQIAKAAGAEEYATDGFKNAQRLLALAETKEGGKKGRSMTAREAVQSAEASRLIAVKRQDADTLAVERKQTSDQLSSARNEATSANASQVIAENAQAKAELAKGQAELERTATLQMAANAVASSASSQADARASKDQAEKARLQTDVALKQVQKTEGEKAVLRADLLRQLNATLQTKDTARGLIVNMSDALFKTGSSDLGSQVREKLSKIAGIVASHSGLLLSVEGHTDSVGTSEYNQGLSERRAQSVSDYLVSQGVESKTISSRGFGKSNPIEGNDTSEGRQKNRRVEVIVSGSAIGQLTQLHN